MKLPNRTKSSVDTKQLLHTFKLYQSLYQAKQSQKDAVDPDLEKIGQLDRHINYDVIRYFASRIIEKRDGMGNANSEQIKQRLISFVTQCMCELLHFSEDLTPAMIITYLLYVEDYTLPNLTPHQFVEAEHLFTDLFAAHPKFRQIYKRLDPWLANGQQASLQIGPGEFLFAFYDRDSTFGVMNNIGYDIIVNHHRTELKSLNTQFGTDMDKLEEIVTDPRTDALMVVLKADPNVQNYEKTLGTRYYWIPLDQPQTSTQLSEQQQSQRLQTLYQHINFDRGKLQLNQLCGV